MKLNFKNVFLFVGIFVFTFAIFGFSTHKAEAAVRTAVVSGAFGDVATWGGLSVPTAADTIIINSNVVVTATAGLTVGDASTGSITNNGTLTITGGDLAVTANAFILNNGTITVSGSLTGAGAFTNAAGETSLVIGGSATINSLIATGAGNIVTYSNATPTCKATGYYRLYFSGGGAVTCATTSIAENLVLTGGATTWTPTGASLAVGGTVFVNTGATFTLPNIAVTITGTTTVAGTINTATGTGTHIFVGLVTVNGTWNLSGQNSPATFKGGLTVAETGTLTSGSGVYTFDTNAQALNGAMTISSITVTGVVLTNNGSLTTNTALAGSGTMTNAGTLNTGGDVSITTLTNSGTFNITGAGAVSTVLANLTNTGTINLNGTMTIAGITNNAGGTVYLTASGTITAFDNATATSEFHIDASPVPTITTLTVTTAGNTVDYGGAAQIIKNVTYRNLTLSGSGIKTATAANLVVAETLTISGGTLSLATANTDTANKLYFGTAYQRSGTWGSTGSASPAATHKSDTYFTDVADGLITINLGASSPHTSTCDSNLTLVNGFCVTLTSDDITDETTTTVTVTTETNSIPGCGARTTGFSSSTGASCVGNTGAATTTPAATVIPGCGNRTTGFSSSSGVSCAGNSVGATGNAYAFGNTLVKMGSKGEACKAWQTFLNDKANANLVTDGWCGKLTINAAKAWQTSANLTADGFLGALSRAKALLQ
jgi:hypothetical protein